MFRDIFRKFSKNPVEKKDKEVVKELVEEGKEHLEELKKIDQRILTVQKSTKTTFSFFAPIHNYCRTQYAWYYNWHAKPYATKVHSGFLALVLVSSLAIGSASMLGNPKLARAADYTCTLNATGNWNDTTKWDNCNGEYPGQTEATVYDVVIPTTLTVTLNVNNLNINNADNSSLGNISVTGTLTTSNNNISFGGMTVNSGGTVTAGSSTFNVYGNWSVSATGTFTYNSSTINMASGGAQSMATGTINNLTATSPGLTLTFTGLVYCRGVFTVGAPTAGGGERVVVTGSGIYYYNALTPIVFQGDYKASAGSTTGGYNISNTTSFFLPQNTDSFMPGGTYGSIYAYTTVNDHTITMQGDVTLGPSTALYLRSATNNKTVTLDMDGHALTANTFTIGNATLTWARLVTGGGTLTVNGVFTIGSSIPANQNILEAGSSTINCYGNFTNNGYLDAGTSTFDFKMTDGTHTLDSGGTGAGKSFFNLIHSGAQAVQLATNDIDIDGTFTNSDGTFDADTNDKNMSFAGDWNNTGDAVFSRGSGTMTFDGTSTVTNSSSGAATLGAVAISGTATLGSDLIMVSNSGAGTLNLGVSHNLTITGTTSPLAVTNFNGGSGTSTTIFTSTTTDTTIPAVAFNNLTLTPGGATTFSLAGHLNAANSTAMTGDLTINANATLQTMPVATSYNIDCVNLSISASGIITANASTFTVSGNWSNSGTFTYGTSTVNVTGAASQINSGGDTAALAMYNLQCVTAGQTVSIVTNNLRMYGTLTVGSASGAKASINSVTANKYIYLQASGTPVTLQGTYDGADGGYNINYLSLIYRASGATSLQTGYYGQILNYSNYTMTQLGEVNLFYGLVLYSYDGGQTATFDTSTYNFTTRVGVDIGAAGNTQHAIFQANNNTITIGTNLTLYDSDGSGGTLYNKLSAGTATIKIGGNYVNQPDTGTPTYSGILDFSGDTVMEFNKASSTQTLSSGGTGASNTFKSLTHSGAGTLQLTTYDINIDGTFTNSGGTFDANNLNMSVAGAFSLSIDTTFTKGGTLTFDGTSTITDSTATKQDLGVVVLNGTSATMASSITVSTLTVTAGTFDLSTSGYTLKLAGTGVTADVLSVAGTFDAHYFVANASIVEYAAIHDDGNVNVPSLNYAKVIFGPAASETYDLAGNLSAGATGISNLDINANATVNTKPVATDYNISCTNLTIASGGTLTANGSTITLVGDWSNAGVFTHGTSTVKFSPGGTSLLTSGGTGDNNDFYILTSDTFRVLRPQTNDVKAATVNVTTSATLDMATNDKTLEVTGTMTVSAGSTYNTGTGTQTINTLDNTGSVTCEGSADNLAITTMTNNDGSLWTYTKSSGTVNVKGGTYHDLTFNDSAGSAVYTPEAGTNTVTGTLTITGGTLAVGDSPNVLNVTENISNTDIITIGTGTLDFEGSLVGFGTITCSGNSVINIGGNWTTFAAFTPGTSTVTFDGSVAQATSSNTWYNLTIANTAGSPSDSVDVDPGAAQTVTNTLTVNDGQWTPYTGDTYKDVSIEAGGIMKPDASANINVSGSWTNAGTFTHNSGTVTFTGTTTAVVSGTTIFNNLTLNTAADGAKTVNFAGSSTQTVAGTTTLAGAADKVLTLGRDGGVAGDHWNLAIAGNMTSGQYVTVGDNNVTGGTITPGSWDLANVVDGGNNHGWDFDHTAPTGTIAIEGTYTKVAAVTLTLSATDTQSNMGTMAFSNDNVTYSDYEAYGVSKAWTLSDNDGAKTVYVKYKDVSGNISTYSANITLDGTAPAVFTPTADPSAWTNANSVSITFATTDATSGVASYSIKVDSGSYTDSVTSPYTLDVSGLSDGTHTVTVKAIDAATNERESNTATLQLDKTAPATFTPSLNTTDWTNSDLTLTFSTTDASSGIASYQVKIDAGAYSTQVSPYTIDISGLSDGTHTATVKAIDNSNNSVEAVAMTYEIDKTAPVISSLPPTTTTPTNLSTVKFTWDAATDATSGLSTYYIFIGTTIAGTDIVNGTATTETSYTQVFTGNGTFYARIKAEDTAGNLSDFSTVGSVVIESEAPNLTIDNIGSAFITTSTFTIQGTVSDNVGPVSSVQIKIDDAAFVNTTYSGSSWSYNWANYAEGNHTITVKASDTAGNTKETSSYIVVVDTVAPSLTSDFRLFNVSNVPAGVYATYLDFAGSTDETSGVNNYEIWKGGAKLFDVPIAKDITNQYYTGSEKQPYYLIDSGLSSGKFTYKIKSIDKAGNISETPDLTVDTAGKTVEIDSITEAKGNLSSVVTAVKTSSIITWKTVYPATSSVEYGESTGYGKKTEVDSNMNQGHSVLLPDLKPATTYHAKVKSHDLYGKDLESQDFTFTTKQAPEDSNVIKVIINALQSLFRTITVGAADTSVSSGTATVDQLSSLQGFSNNLLVTDISFKEKGYFGNILTFEKGKKIEKSTDDKSYSTVNTKDNSYFDKEVKENTTYYYRLDGGNPVVRKPVVGDDSTLAIKEASVIKESVEVSKDAAQLTVFWTTNRGSSSQVEFGPSTSYGQKTKEDTSLNMGHNVVLESLSPDTIYHFRATSKDAKGNSVTSEDFTFQTPTAQKDKTAIDLIFESFQRVWNSVTGIF